MRTPRHLLGELYPVVRSSSALHCRHVGLHRNLDIDIESEDEEDEVDEDDDDDDAQSMRSTSVSTAGTSKALTARQAVLANVVDASHVSLGMHTYLQ